MEDLEAIRRQRERWIAAVNARDVDRYLDVLTEDVVWLPPGQAALRGRDAFGSWVRPFFERFHYSFDVTNPSVRPAGDWAVERGEFRTQMTALEDEHRGNHVGDYLILWRRESDGMWRIERYVDETGLNDEAS